MPSLLDPMGSSTPTTFCSPTANNSTMCRSPDAPAFSYLNEERASTLVPWPPHDTILASGHSHESAPPASQFPIRHGRPTPICDLHAQRVFEYSLLRRHPSPGVHLPHYVIFATVSTRPRDRGELLNQKSSGTQGERTATPPYPFKTALTTGGKLQGSSP